MLRKILSYGALPLFLLLLWTIPPRAGRAQSAPEGFNQGPDIITGEVAPYGGLAEFGNSGTQVGLAMWTTICNAGNVPVNVFAMPATDHAIIPQNLYRMSRGAGNNDRFEQIGHSWVKHMFASSTMNDCGFGCTSEGTDTLLGVGCSDVYASDQNAWQNDLTSRAWINPFTGVFSSASRNHSGHVHTGTSHRLLVESNDLNTTMNPGATYYAEVQYLSPHEYNWCQSHPGQCNMYNNVSYRQFNVSGTTSFFFTPAAPSVLMSPAVTAWTGATINPIEPAAGVDGRAFIAYKVTGPDAGVWHYEYALYNMNLDRAIQSFSVPLGCAITLSNLGFHAPPNHPGSPNDGTLGGAGFSNAPWTSNQTTDALSWSSETFAQNENANAIRWGTLYNFRFDSNKPPMGTNATIGFFKTGAPVTVAILAPNACDQVPSPTPTPTLTPGVTPTPTATATPPAASPTPTPSVTPSPVPTPILPPAGNGKIAFHSTRPGNFDVFVMDPDGSNQTNITNKPLFDYYPAWSPDGTKIAFSSDHKGNIDIYVMGADGSNPIRLTTDPAIDLVPRWSPDSTKIVFYSDRDGNNEIYVMGADGSNQTRLTNNPADENDPAWSPDGQKIVFTSSQDGSDEIYLMDADGSNQTNLTNRSGPDFSPAWSPDGTKIAFSSSRKGGGIFVMNRDGTNVNQLTTSGPPFIDGGAVWSPDGTKIAFHRTISGNADIFVMNADGSNQASITNDPAVDVRPDWQRVALPAAQAIQLSTRMFVQTGDNVGIGGFIITGSVPKQVMVRAVSASTVLGALADPVLELHGPPGFATIINDNCDPGDLGSPFCQPGSLDSLIEASLDPGAYTAIVRGNNDTTGVALVEIFDLNPSVDSKLANISTRAFVNTADHIVIAGFIIGGNSGHDRIVARGIGPSLTDLGVPNALADPTLELRDENGVLLISNNDWQDTPIGVDPIIIALGLAPTSDLESAFTAVLPPGPYTALLAGRNNGTGIGVVEVYDIGAP